MNVICKGGREAADYSQKKLHHHFDRQLSVAAKNGHPSTDVLRAPLGVRAMTSAFLQTDADFPAHILNRGLKSDAGCTAAVIALDLANCRLLSANAGDAQCVVRKFSLVRFL
jgi:serine/threonine protein phosphatase PrpC